MNSCFFCGVFGEVMEMWLGDRLLDVCWECWPDKFVDEHWRR